MKYKVRIKRTSEFDGELSDGMIITGIFEAENETEARMRADDEIARKEAMIFSALVEVGKTAMAGRIARSARMEILSIEATE